MGWGKHSHGGTTQVGLWGWAPPCTGPANTMASQGTGLQHSPCSQTVWGQGELS